MPTTFRAVVLGVRVFFIGAMIAAGIVELWAENFFSTPVQQLGVSAFAGAAALIAAKLAHVV